MANEKAALAKRNIGHILSNGSVVLTTVIVFFTFGLFNKNFISYANIQNILSAAAPLVLMAVGLTFVLLTGSIDLSTGTVCTVSCVVTVMYIEDLGSAVFLPVLAMGLMAGLLNGLLITGFKMPAFIVTLCTANIWKCAALVMSGGASKSIPIASWGIIEWTKGTILGMPVLFVAALAVWLIFVLIERFTAMGRSIYAIGANERAARMMGIEIKKARITAYLLSGMGSALAGACYALRLKSSSPTLGDSMNLTAVATVVLGGTWLSGGHGSVMRTLPSALTIIMIQTALKVVGLDAYYQNIIFGIILIVAICINSDRSSNRSVIIK